MNQCSPLSAADIGIKAYTAVADNQAETAPAA